MQKQEKQTGDKTHWVVKPRTSVPICSLQNGEGTWEGLMEVQLQGFLAVPQVSKLAKQITRHEFHQRFAIKKRTCSGTPYSISRSLFVRRRSIVHNQGYEGILWNSREKLKKKWLEAMDREKERIDKQDIRWHTGSQSSSHFTLGFLVSMRKMRRTVCPTAGNYKRPSSGFKTCEAEHSPSFKSSKNGKQWMLQNRQEG